MKPDSVNLNSGRRFDRFPLLLGRGRIYLLPTRYGVVFFFALSAMLFGAVNHNNNFAFLMTFLLAGIALVGLLACHRNLAGICIHSVSSEPVFAGETAVFTISVSVPKTIRSGLSAVFDGSDPVRFSLSPGAPTGIGAPVAADRRGLLKPPTLRLSTVYPFGLFRAWATVAPEASVPVFPRPAASSLKMTKRPGGEGAETRRIGGQAEDFEGLWPYRPGDPMQHIAWKAFSKGRGLMVKRFISAVGASFFIDWDQVPVRDVEKKLSILCGKVLRADQSGASYGLALPGVHLPPAAGPAHRFECLKALAVFGLGEEGT
ncbi:MAG: DUF58 domain-containing protein [Desulfobacterales bacterium]|nr:DUF58 domain-containing protein [Desulfobacterales bacterium]